MSTAVRSYTPSPHRKKALEYGRAERVIIHTAVRGRAGRPDHVEATIAPNPGDASGQSVTVHVRLLDGRWDCTKHRGHTACAHRLAVQIPTGWGHLAGGWEASGAVPEAGAA